MFLYKQCKILMGEILGLVLLDYFFFLDILILGFIPVNNTEIYYLLTSPTVFLNR